MPENSILKAMNISQYDGRKLFITFLILTITLIIDISISSIADIISKQVTAFWGISLFIIISAVYIIGQYLILGMLKAKNKESKIESFYTRTLDRIVKIAQYILTAIIISVALQVIVTSHYYTNLLTAATTISYGLAILLMTLLAYRFFSWLRRSRSLVLFLYGSAAAIITLNAIDTIVYYDVILLGKPPIVSPNSEVIFQTGFTPGTPMSVVKLVQTYSLIGYFLLTWGGTILLLRHNIQRVGKIKFWILVTAPLVFFMSYYVSYYQTFYPSSPVTTAISSNLMIPILLFMYSIILCGVLFGIGFRFVAMFVSPSSHVRDYMIITAYGFILFFAAASATVLQAGYPPFGLASVSFVGLASYLILTGLYNSAISVAQDAKLRSSIRRSVEVSSVKQSRLLDSIGTAEITKEIENNVLKITKDNAQELIQQTGIEPTLTDREIKDYVDEVLQEVHQNKKGK
jgi:hypothetical protein